MRALAKQDKQIIDPLLNYPNHKSCPELSLKFQEESFTLQYLIPFLMNFRQQGWLVSKTLTRRQVCLTMNAIDTTLLSYDF